MTSNRQQKGITLTGLLMASVVFGVAALAFMKFWPVYNEKFKVDLAMDRLATTPGAERMTKVSLAKVLQKQFDVDGIEPVPYNLLAKTLKTEKKKGQKDKFVTFEYEIRKPLNEELDVILKYNKTVKLGSEKTD